MFKTFGEPCYKKVEKDLKSKLKEYKVASIDVSKFSQINQFSLERELIVFMENK